MSDLISRSALIEECNELSAIEWNQKAAPVSWADAYEHFADELENAPAVDAVKVIRCRECSRRYSENLCPMCVLIDGVFYEYTLDDGWCDRGERK